MRRRHALLVVVMALVVCATPPPVASAGTYVINNCNVPGLPSAAIGPWYWEGGAVNVTPVDSCAHGGGFAFFFGSTLSMPRGAVVSLAVAFPQDGPISIRRARLWVVGRLGGTGSAMFVGTNSGAPGQNTNSDLFAPPGGETLTTPHTTSLLPVGTNVLRLMLYCSQSSEDDCYPSNRTVVEVVGVETTLLESVAPSVSVTGGNLVVNEPQSGKRTLRYSARDGESGVQAVDALVDGAVAAKRDFGPECPRVNPAACPTARMEELTIDTDTLTEGSHQVRLRVTDAAGNSAESPAQTIGVRRSEVAGAPVGVLRSRHLTAFFSGNRKRSLIASFNGRPKVNGRLTNADGGPVSNAPLVVVEKQAGRAANATPVGSTGSDGRYAFRLRSRRGSRTVRVQLGSGDGGDLVVSPPLRLKVRASASLAVMLRGVRVRYHGRVLSGPIPRRGAVVLVQGRRRGGAWQSFASRRVRSVGRFEGTYRLRVRRPGVVLQFRVVVSKAADYPYEVGASSTVTRTVR